MNKTIDDLYQEIYSDLELPQGLSENIVTWRCFAPDDVPPSQVMIIGEAPGQGEDKMGIPFVGRSGKLLDTIIRDLHEHSVYITNLVKQRPPNNRPPTEDEISFYLPYVIREIEVVNPKIILLCGQTAYTAILSIKDRISDVRGQFFTMGGYKFMPIFHPSYLLRNHSDKIGSPRWLTEMDIEKVKRELDNE